MTPSEDLAHVIFGALSDPNRTESDLAIIEAILRRSAVQLLRRELAKERARVRRMITKFHRDERKFAGYEDSKDRKRWHMYAAIVLEQVLTALKKGTR
jgi:hypothetical protein